LGPNFQNIIGSVNEKYWFSQIQIGKDGFAAQNAGWKKGSYIKTNGSEGFKEHSTFNCKLFLLLVVY